jgi:NOP5NT (NUC127) domain-containing protein
VHRTAFYYFQLGVTLWTGPLVRVEISRSTRHYRVDSNSTMLVLCETAMGFALFKLTDTAKLTDPSLYKEFETPERANELCVPPKYFFTIRDILFSFTCWTLFSHRMQAEIEIVAPIHVDCDCR